MMISCGIDMGTNSFRLLVSEVRGGCLFPLAQELITVRLGQGLGVSGLLSSAALLRAEAALVRFGEIMAPYSLHSVRVCATHAVRYATNGKDFIQRIESLTGLRVEVLSGEEEARLALLGVLSALPEEHHRYPLVLVDVGGGSTEIIRQANAEVEPWLISLPLGAVALTEEFGADSAAMRKMIQATLAPALRRLAEEAPLGSGSLLVASGGTATSLAALALDMERYDAQRVQNYLLSQTQLDALVARLTNLSPEERNGVVGLADGRGEIIVAGALVLQEVQQALASPLLVSDAGLLEGIVLSGVKAC